MMSPGAVRPLPPFLVTPLQRYSLILYTSIGNGPDPDMQAGDISPQKALDWDIR